MDDYNDADLSEFEALYTFDPLALEPDNFEPDWRALDYLLEDIEELKQ